MLNPVVLRAAGYDPASASQKARMTTGSSALPASLLSVTRLRALGKEKRNLLIVVHSLPTSAGVEGVLGLDFLRGTKLEIDFSAGTIDLS